jgi:NDP-sugar pyrophosphorylase family protein
MPIGDMPILEVILHQMRRAGVNHAILTVGHLAELLRLFFQSGERIGLDVTYSYEDQPLGTAGPLSLIPDLDDTFLVSNGDVLTTLDLSELIAFHQAKKAVATIATHHRQVNVNLGVLELDSNSQVRGYIEKPTYDYMVSMGIYVFEPSVLSYIAYNQYLDFPDLVQILLEDGRKVVGYPFSGYWQDLGRPDDYEQAAQDFERMKGQFLPN